MLHHNVACTAKWWFVINLLLLLLLLRPWHAGDADTAHAVSQHCHTGMLLLCRQLCCCCCCCCCCHDTQVMLTLGMLSAGVVDWALNAVAGPGAWRWMVGLPAAPGDMSDIHSELFF
jgi:hypothetical protein